MIGKNEPPIQQNPTAKVVVVADLKTGDVQIKHPQDRVLAIQILAQAIQAMAQKHAVAMQQAAAEAVQVAPAGVLRQLRRIDDEGRKNGKG
jgi:hypothetical protein